MSDIIVVSQCKCGKWQDNHGTDHECVCGAIFGKKATILEKFPKKKRQLKLYLNKSYPVSKNRRY